MKHDYRTQFDRVMFRWMLVVMLGIAAAIAWRMVYQGATPYIRHDIATQYCIKHGGLYLREHRTCVRTIPCPQCGGRQ